MTEDEGFLQRWSRRKQSALRDDESVEDEQSSTSGSGEEAEAMPENSSPVEPASGLENRAEAQPEPESPADEDMPPLESIDEGGSVSAFFSPRVSEGLRRAALRRLFRQPKYNFVDMLDDYAEDYSKPAALGDIVTADMRYRTEQAAKRMEQKLKESLAETGEQGDENQQADSPALATTGEDVDMPADQAPSTEDAGVADTDHQTVAAEDGDDDPDRQPG